MMGQSDITLHIPLGTQKPQVTSGFLYSFSKPFSLGACSGQHNGQQIRASTSNKNKLLPAICSRRSHNAQPAYCPRRACPSGGVFQPHSIIYMDSLSWASTNQLQLYTCLMGFLAVTLYAAPMPAPVRPPRYLWVGGWGRPCCCYARPSC